MAPWPTSSEYSRAVAQRAFVDPRLAGLTGRRMKRVNRPVLFTGQFSATFGLEDQDREPKALKLFTRGVPDRAERYAAIAAFLNRLESRFFVRFDYLDEAVRIDADHHPGLLMEWARGTSLDVFITRSLGNPDALKQVALDLLAFCEMAEQEGFAHGDLQHENILVVDRLRLIDYDGMYVPALAGRSPAEHGHLNYQHPGRIRQAFGPGIDRFSAIVIYLGLYTAIVAPEVYAAHAVENGLLFRKADFEDPKRSATLAALGRTRGLARATRSFVALCEGAVEQVPPLSTFAARARIDLRRSSMWPARWTSLLDDAGRTGAAASIGPLRAAALPIRWASRAGRSAASIGTAAADRLHRSGLRLWTDSAWRPLFWAAAIVIFYAFVIHLRVPDAPPPPRPAPPAATDPATAVGPTAHQAGPAEPAGTPGAEPDRCEERIARPADDQKCCTAACAAEAAAADRPDDPAVNVTPDPR